MAATLIIIPKENGGQRLDKFILDEFPKSSFGLVQKLCRKGQVRVNGGRVKGSRRLAVGDVLRLPPRFGEEEVEIKKDRDQPFTLTDKDRKQVPNWIIYEDGEIVVLNKPAGLPSQAGTDHNRSMDRILGAYYPGSIPRLVHRLDKDTTGCLVMARKRQKASELSQLFKTRDMQKIYWALVRGHLTEQQGKISLPLEKTDSGVVVNEESGKSAMTLYQVLATAGDLHLIAVKPTTGRMHQIRVHMSEIGAPLVGDRKYGGEPLDIDDLPKAQNNMFLHAWQIEFAKHKFNAPMPKHFKDVFDYVGWTENECLDQLETSGFLDV